MMERTSLEIRYGVRWYDPEQTTLWCECSPRWTWIEAQRTVRKINLLCSAIARPTYVVIRCSKDEITSLPAGGAIFNLRQLMLAEPRNNQLVILVGASSLLRQLLLMTGQVYRLQEQLSRYRFVSTPEEAIALIEKHKQLSPCASVS